MIIVMMDIDCMQLNQASDFIITSLNYYYTFVPTFVVRPFCIFASIMSFWIIIIKLFAYGWVDLY